MENGNSTIFSGRTTSGRTTYFIDVRQAVNFRYYITVTESRRVSETGFDQNRIFVFEENLIEVRDLINRAFEEMERAGERRGPLPQGPVSSQHERSGKAWTDQEEETLRKAFAEGTELETVAGELRRSVYAVTLRLEKLGLIDRPEQPGLDSDSA